MSNLVPHIPKLFMKRVLGNSEKKLRRQYSDLQHLKVSQVDGVRKIVMSDLKTKNSLSLNMIQGLHDAITQDEDNKELRCIVISSARQEKNNVFSSGFNLKQLGDGKGREVFEEFNKLMMDIVRSPVPVIAAVDGLAAAAGCQLVAQCDIAVCTPTASFSTPGARFGVFCSSPGVALVRSIPLKVAADMLFTGEALTAQDALRVGLVSRLSPSAQLDDVVRDITTRIMSTSRQVLQLGKEFLYQQLEMNLSTAYKRSAEVMEKNLALEDGAEGVRSFMEKRNPLWSHAPLRL